MVGLTDEMIEAGVVAAQRHGIAGEANELVRSIYHEMQAVAPLRSYIRAAPAVMPEQFQGTVDGSGSDL